VLLDGQPVDGGKLSPAVPSKDWPDFVKRVATRVTVWDGTTGARLFEHGRGWTYLTAFSPDGRRLAVASFAADRFAERLARLGPFPEQREAEQFLQAVAQVLNALADIHTEVTVLDATTGQELRSLRGPIGWTYFLAFTPDADRLAVASLPLGKALRQLAALVRDLWRSVADPNRATPLVGALAEVRTEVRICNVTGNREPVQLAGSTGWVYNLAFSPAGRSLALAGFSGDALCRHYLVSTAVGQVAAAFMPVGIPFNWQDELTRSQTNDVSVWDTATGREVSTARVAAGAVFDLAFSPGGRRLAGAAIPLDQFVRPNARADARAIQARVKVWEAATGREVLELEAPPFAAPVNPQPADAFQYWKDLLTGLTFSADGDRLLMLGGDPQRKGAKAWDARTGRELLALRERSAIAFSADGRRVATAGEDNTVKIWDPATGQELLTLRGHADRVTALAFSRDGSRLTSVDVQGTVKTWDAAPPPSPP
jgi:WD40 repeat protein